MKLAIIILICIVLLFLAFGFYKANELRNIQITKTVSIQAPKNDVFDMVRYFKNYPEWSPFLAQDPTQQYEIKETDGTVGAQYHWEGNKGKDLGYQEIVAIEPDNFIKMKCYIQKPFKAEPTFEYNFKEDAGHTIVAQNFKLESGWVDAFFMWIFGAKPEMEKTNQQGLELLKQVVENKG